jgi:hypothetical protein
MAVGIVSTVSSPGLWFAGVESASTLRSILDGFHEGRPEYLYQRRRRSTTERRRSTLADHWWIEGFGCLPLRREEPRLQHKLSTWLSVAKLKREASE